MTPLPDDAPTLRAMVRQPLGEVARLRAGNADFQAKLDAALEHRFGRRSERREPATATSPDKPPPRRDEHGRSPLPDHLERREVVRDLTDAERLCPCRGRPRACIGTQTAEQLDLDPAKFFVLRTVKTSYACRHCDPAVVPPEPPLRTAGPGRVGPIAKGLCGPGLLAHVVTAKFADHTPVHRLAGQLARSGVTAPSSTLGDWPARAADLLSPLTQLMHRRMLMSRVIPGGDTGVKLRAPGADRTRKAHLWTGIGDADFPDVVFDFTTDYTADGPDEFFRGFTGHLQADALARYDRLYTEGGVRHVRCRAHARRKFVAAADGGDVRANPAVEFVRKLYAVERPLPPPLPPSDDPAAAAARTAREEQRRLIRPSDARPVLDELKAWLDAIRPGALPKSPPGVAVGYATNNWAALGRYADRGYLAIDNNLSERTPRAVALGRNNGGVIGSEVGGRTAAVLYSAVGTCEHLGIDPFAYLRDALPGLFALGEEPAAEQLSEWRPDRWLSRRGRDRPPPPAVAG